MPSYLWSGTNSSGEPTTERVTAASPEAAQKLLLERGWTQLRRETSEINDFLDQGMKAVSDPDYQPKLTPEQEKAYLQGTAPGFWANWWQAERQSGALYLLFGLWLVLSVYLHHTWAIILCGGMLVGLAFVYPSIHFWFSRSSALFEQLHQARTWHRWPEVLTCVQALQRLQASRRIGIAEVELTRYRALALAGLGKLDEALGQFTRAADAAKMPRWLYYSHLASIYTVAKQYDRGLECYRQALEQTTEKGIVCIDYGCYLVQRFNRPAEARHLLALAEATPLPTNAGNHVAALRSLIALREGDFVTAEQFMSQALAGFEHHPKGRRFIFEAAILLSQGYLALIHAALGNQKAARDYFAKSEKYLATIHMEELLADYRQRMHLS